MLAFGPQMLEFLRFEELVEWQCLGCDECHNLFNQ